MLLQIYIKPAFSDPLLVIFKQPKPLIRGSTSYLFLIYIELSTSVFFWGFVWFGMVFLLKKKTHTSFCTDYFYPDLLI